MKKIYENPEFVVKRLSLIDVIMSSKKGEIPTQGGYTPEPTPGDEIPDPF